MSTQWHPLFAHLLGLLVGDYYEVEPEVPVSDLPRRGDVLVVRRHGGPEPPFRGLWTHLTDWNVLEFKGPSDRPEEDDLDLLVHVGSGITYRLNEERRARGQERLPNRQVSFWYLAPVLGETFLEHALARTHLDYETGGLWRGRVWGHPLWFLSYREAPVEEDTIPLRLLDREPGAPAALGELVLQSQELLGRFGPWLYALQPGLWEEVRHMTGASSGIIDWEAVGKIANLDEVVRILPPERIVQVLGAERIIQVLGVARAVQVIGLDRVVEAVGLPRVLDTVGLPRVIEAVGLPRLVESVGLPRLVESVGLPRLVESVGLPQLIESVGLPRLIEASGAEKVLDELLAHIPAEQLAEMLRRRQEKG
jgi:hypothetical protein